MVQPRDDLLEPVRTAQRELWAELARLSPADFEAASACSGWTVRDVLAHLRLLVARYPTSLVLGLQGITDRPWTYLLAGETYEEADRREFAEMRQRPGAILASEFVALADAMIELFAHLTPEDQDRPVGTPRGVYKARHLPFFYTYELGIHDWDIWAGVDPRAGLRPAIRAAFARVLRSRLPVLIKDPEAASASREWRLAIGEPVNRTWALSPVSGGYRVVEEPAGVSASDLETDLDMLALVTSGRLSASHALEQERWQTRDRSAALRFGELFAGPV